ncbi:hypothetical protein BDL97_19G003800 [Sphagnum fallax]|nr:hypothetical protein BDL97_19G003800 [Sphagnum fallax]
MWIDAMQICTWFLLMSFRIQGCKGEREGEEREKLWQEFVAADPKLQ